MKKVIKNTKTNIKTNKKAKKIVEGLEEVILDDQEEAAEPVAQEELDPEILEALNIKKRAKAKPVKAVDYIPELERDESDFGDA